MLSPVGKSKGQVDRPSEPGFAIHDNEVHRESVSPFLKRENRSMHSYPSYTM